MVNIFIDTTFYRDDWSVKFVAETKSNYIMLSF